MTTTQNRLKNILATARPPMPVRKVVYALTHEEQSRFVDWFDGLDEAEQNAFWDSTDDQAKGQLEIEGVKFPPPAPRPVSIDEDTPVDRDEVLDQLLRDKDRRGRPRDLSDDAIKYAVSEANLDVDGMRADVIDSLCDKFAKAQKTSADALTDQQKQTACQDLTKKLRAKLLETVGDLFESPKQKVMAAAERDGWMVVQQAPITRPKELGANHYGHAALLRQDDTWGVAYSTIAVAKQTYGLFIPKFDEKEATRVYKDLFLPAARKHAAFRRLRDYKREVELLTAKDRWSTKDQEALPFNVGFFIALYVHYDTDSKVRWKEDRSSGRVYRGLRDRVIALTNNMLLPDGPRYESTAVANDVVVPLATADERMDTPIKKQAFRDRVDWLRRGLGKAIEKWPARYEHLTALRDRLGDVEERVAEDESREWHEEERFPAFGLELLQAVLESAWKAGVNVYFACILQLSTCLRNNEMQRLSRDFLLGDCTLDYRVTRFIAALGRDEHLSTKTSDKIARSELTNPRASIITRTILNHFVRYQCPSDQQLKNFWDDLKEAFCDSRVRNGKNLRKGLIVPRALRTTGATMLRFTRQTLSFPRLENEDIAARMTHSTTLMIERVYARNPPPGSAGYAPHVYLGFGDRVVVTATVKHNGQEEARECDISSQDCAWDAWLLRDVLDHFRSEIKAAEEKGRSAVEEAELNYAQLKSFVYQEFIKGLPLNIDPEKAKEEVQRLYKGRTADTRY